MGMEKNYGSIAVGKLANFTVLEENPLTINAADIKNIKVKATVVEGQHYPVSQN
jgi:predicted amidohydrolase YtcJ